MLLGKTHYNLDFYLPSSREPLRIVNREKDLGVIIDDKLSFSIHITGQVNKANRIMGAIRTSFNDLNSDNLLNLFKTMIHTHLEYDASVWSTHMKKDIHLDENVQRRATKQLPTISKLPYNERLRQPDLPTLRYRYIPGDMIAGLYFLLDCSTLSSIFSLGLVSFKFTSPCVEYVSKNRVTK